MTPGEGRGVIIPFNDLEHSRHAHEFVGAEHLDVPFCVILVHSAPGVGPKLHRHPYPEVFIVEAGEATFRIGEAADLLGVSSDTVRRWVDLGRLAATRDEHGHRMINGFDLAAFVRDQGSGPDERSEASSARNRLRGIVTAIVKDTVMAQVDIQAGPFRIVSLMSREAVDQMDLQVGSLAVAVIKSTNVVVETHRPL